MHSAPRVQPFAHDRHRPLSRLSSGVDGSDSGSGSGSDDEGEEDEPETPVGDGADSRLRSDADDGAAGRELDLSLLSSGEEHAERQLLRQMQHAALMHSQSARGGGPAVPSAFGRAPFVSISAAASPRDSRRHRSDSGSASARRSHSIGGAFSPAELDILQRLDALRIGLESYRSHTATSLRTLSRAGAASKGQMQALMARQLADLETRLSRAWNDHDSATQEALAAQVEKLRVDLSQLRRRDHSRMDTLEQRVRGAETGLEELRDATMQQLDGNHARLAQVKAELQGQFAQRLLILQSELQAQLNMPRPAPLLLPEAAPSPSLAATAALLQPLSAEVASLKEQNALLAQKLSDMDAAFAQRCRESERKSASIVAESERTQGHAQQEAIEALEAVFTARIGALETRLAKESSARERAARDAAEEARRRHDALETDFEARVAAVRLEAEDKLREHAARAAAALARSDALAQQAAQKLAAQIAERAATNSAASAAAAAAAAQQQQQLQQQSADNSSSTTPSHLSQQISHLSSRISSCEAGWRAGLDTEARKRRELQKRKLRAYEEVQKQMMDDVVAIHAQLDRVATAQAKAKSAAAAATAAHAETGAAVLQVQQVVAAQQAALAQVQHDLATQHSNLSSQHDALQQLMASASASAAAPAARKLAPLQEQAGRSAAAPDAHTAATGTGAGDAAVAALPSDSGAAADSEGVPSSGGAAVTQTQAQLIRSQKKLIVRYRALVEEVAALRVAQGAAQECLAEQKRALQAEMERLEKAAAQAAASAAAAAQAATAAAASASAAVTAPAASAAALSPSSSSASAATPSSPGTVALSDFQVLSSSHAALEARLFEYVQKHASERQSLLRSVDVVAERADAAEGRLREQILQGGARVADAEAQWREASASASQRVSDLEARLHQATHDATAGIKQVVAAVGALQSSHVEREEFDGAQSLLAALQSASKVAATEVGDLRAALVRVESGMGALRIDASNQESFNYDLSSQLVKLGSACKALDGRVSFLAESRLPAVERRVQDAKAHVDESLSALSAALQSNGVSLQKSQDRLVSVLDSLQELERSLALQHAAAKKHEHKLNVMEQTLESGPASAAQRDASSPVASSSTVTSILARVQALESEVSRTIQHTRCCTAALPHRTALVLFVFPLHSTRH